MIPLSKSNPSRRLYCSIVISTKDLITLLRLTVHAPTHMQPMNGAKVGVLLHKLLHTSILCGSGNGIGVAIAMPT